MILKLTLRHLLSKPFLTLLTLLAIAGSLSMLGAFWTIVENIQRMKVTQTATVGPDALPDLSIFVDSKLSPKEMTALKKHFTDDTRFSEAAVVEPKEAMKALESQFGETLSKAFGDDPLPLTMKLRFAKPSMNRDEFVTLLNEIRSVPGVLDVDDGLSVMPEEHGTFSQKVFSWAAGLLIAVFAVVALLVSHLIRIAFESLRGEVETLKVLGASKFWIFKPLLLEGFIFGLAGALVSLLILSFGVELILPHFSSLLLPKGIEVVRLSALSSFGILFLGIAASVAGALFTWPLIQRPPTEI